MGGGAGLVMTRRSRSGRLRGNGKRGGALVGASEILEEWQGKRVSIKLPRGGLLRGELLRSDAVGMLLAVEQRPDPTPGGGRVAAGPDEDGPPLFSFVPWSQIEMVIPSPVELP